MSHVPHEVAEEFPHMLEEISALKQSNAHFAKLLESYHSVNRAIHRAETNIEPTDDLNMIQMRKERLHLKDEIAACLTMA